MPRRGPMFSIPAPESYPCGEEIFEQMEGQEEARQAIISERLNVIIPEGERKKDVEFSQFVKEFEQACYHFYYEKTDNLTARREFYPAELEGLLEKRDKLLQFGEFLDGEKFKSPLESESLGEPIDPHQVMEGIHSLILYLSDAVEQARQPVGRPKKTDRAKFCYRLIEILKRYTDVELKKSNASSPYREYMNYALDLTYGHHPDRNIKRITKPAIEKYEQTKERNRVRN